MKLARKIGTAQRWIRSRSRDRGALLLYHRVAHLERDPFRLAVSPEHFSSQMEILRETRNPIGLREFLDRHREGNLDQNSTVVTFDDGYLDFSTTALPILEKHEIPAVLYCLGSAYGSPPWWDRLLESLFALADSRGLVRPESSPPMGNLLREAATPLRAFGALYLDLKMRPSDERLRILEQLEADRESETKKELGRLMTENEIRQLASHPLVTIGAHTMTHSSLAQLSPAEQAREIEGSIRHLAQVIEKPITTFSYPFGIRGRDYNRITMDLVRKSGLDHALAADIGCASSEDDPFALPRLWVHDLPGRRLRGQLDRWL